jgi:plasmid stabilization system protein ParE
VKSPAVLTIEARNDLRTELRRIGPDSIVRARAFRDAIGAAARRIGERPLLGRREIELLPDPYRFW